MRKRMGSGSLSIAIAIALPLAISGTFGCGGSEASLLDGPFDAALNGLSDGTDGTDTVADARSETAIDAAADVLPDVTEDSPLDATQEAGPDVEQDASPDADACEVGQTLCGTTCVDTDSNHSHCGACDNGCPTDQVCSVGACSLSCTPGLTACDGACLDLTSNADNCGACGQACDLPHAMGACTNSTCAIGSCLAGWDDCNSAVVDGCEMEVDSDPFSCGACGSICAPDNAIPSCASGLCTIGSCSQGFVDCNSSATDGCEAAISTDTLNCGTCGNACDLAHATAHCSSAACGIAACDSGWADCNEDPTDGCETALTTDSSNCGGCGSVCSLAHATASCTNALCAVSSCESGFADCNSVASDGCETNTLTDPANCNLCGQVCGDGQVCSGGTCSLVCPIGTTDCSGACVSLSSDPANCGSCGTACTLTNATAACTSGACTIASCTAGFVNCNGLVADGCEVSLQSDPLNCGACGLVCTLPQATPSCTSGLCAIASCGEGYGDCNKLATDGCETSLLTDEQNCGVCGTVCILPNATSTCAAGACEIQACKPGYADCNALASDGCEINIMNNTNNCGACGSACELPNATPKCSSGTCAIATCKPGFADCNSSPIDGCEVELATSALNCGSCGTVCALANASEACVSGECNVTSCDAGYDDCNQVAADGCEVNLQSDGDNCGACANDCATGMYCSNGDCSSTCAAGLTLCGDSCINLKTDAASCGSCGFVCSMPNAIPSCSNGSCAIADCLGSWEDCNKLTTDGCEVNTDVDAANCGTCGAACTLQNATAACSASACAVASCNAGFGDCNWLSADGCESDTASDVFNCGACNRGCSSSNVASVSCASGLCNSTCDRGWGNCASPAAPNMDDGCELDVSSADKTCGSCSNNCSLQGSGGGLVCDGGQRPKNQCGCSSHGACSTIGAPGTCNISTGLCACGGDLCDPGETCAKSGASSICSCNGDTSCQPGATCCQTPAGCHVLTTDASNCGACGHSCPPGFSCSTGGCTCTSSSSCNAGSPGTCGAGLCTCAGTKCAPGERCQSNGTCG